MNLRNAVIVLGAGASKGAALPGTRTPPLDADFLNVTVEYFARKRARGKGRSIVKVWNDFKRTCWPRHHDSAPLETRAVVNLSGSASKSERHVIRPRTPS